MTNETKLTQEEIAEKNKQELEQAKHLKEVSDTQVKKNVSEMRRRQEKEKEAKAHPTNVKAADASSLPKEVLENMEFEKNKEKWEQDRQEKLKKEFKKA